MRNETLIYAPAEAQDLGGGGGRWQPTGSWGAGLPRPTWPEAVKRAVDVVGSALLIAFFFLFFLIVGLALLVGHGRPVFYSHQRIGRGGVPFGCLKFRTMHRDADRILEDHLRADPAAQTEWRDTQKLRRDPRVHALGSLLRRSSLDELPQLGNVFAGSMSLVGPRPIIRSEASQYGGRIGCYLALRPGLTGLWQVSGRNNTTYAERVDLDERYFKERSLLLDLKILLRTIGVVLLARGAY